MCSTYGLEQSNQDWGNEENVISQLPDLPEISGTALSLFVSNL